MTPKKLSTRRPKTPNGQNKKKRSTTKDSANSEELYEVEAIIEKRLNEGTVEFLVKWKGYSFDDLTWEPMNNLLRTCADLIEEFEKSDAFSEESVGVPSALFGLAQEFSESCTVSSTNLQAMQSEAAACCTPTANSSRTPGFVRKKSSRTSTRKRTLKCKKASEPGRPTSTLPLFNEPEIGESQTITLSISISDGLEETDEKSLPFNESLGIIHGELVNGKFSEACISLSPNTSPKSSSLNELITGEQSEEVRTSSDLAPSSSPLNESMMEAKESELSRSLFSTDVSVVECSQIAESQAITLSLSTLSFTCDGDDSRKNALETEAKEAEDAEDDESAFLSQGKWERPPRPGSCTWRRLQDLARSLDLVTRIEDDQLIVRDQQGKKPDTEVHVLEQSCELEILGAKDDENGFIMVLVEWRNRARHERIQKFVRSSEMCKHIPLLLIEFYEAQVRILPDDSFSF